MQCTLFDDRAWLKWVFKIWLMVFKVNSLKSDNFSTGILEFLYGGPKLYDNVWNCNKMLHWNILCEQLLAHKEASFWHWCCRNIHSLIFIFLNYEFKSVLNVCESWLDFNEMMLIFRGEFCPNPPGKAARRISRSVPGGEYKFSV